MIDSFFRKPYQTICVDPVLQLAVKSKLNPTTITGIALLSGLLIIPALAVNAPYWALLLLLVSGYCDTLDGSLARETGRTTPIGAICDIVADRIVEFSVFLGLLLVDSHTRGFPCLMMCGATLLCVTTFLVVGIFTENESEKGFHYSPGIMERAEAFFFFGLMILLPGIFNTLACTFSGLVILTALIRVKDFITLK